MNKIKIFIIIILSTLTTAAAYTGCYYDPMIECTTHACCATVTNGAKPYFDGSVCTSKPQPYENGADCDYNGANTGVKIGNMCVSKTNAPVANNSSWCDVMGLIRSSASYSSPDYYCKPNVGVNTGNPGNFDICGVAGARIPSIIELLQIADRCHSNPLIRKKLSFNVVAYDYWSSSDNMASFWYISAGTGTFYGSAGSFVSRSDGSKLGYFHSSSNAIRCVKDL